MQATKEKGCPDGSLIPNYVLADAESITLSQINLQVSRLTRRCAISATMAAIVAPLIFGEAR
jgi:hypothetical protein